MLRIDIGPESTDAVRLRLSGALTGPWVQELAAACERLRDATAASVLDLTELAFADVSGQRLLRQLRGEGFRLEGLSPFLAAQLAEEGRPSAHPG